MGGRWIEWGEDQIECFQLGCMPEEIWLGIGLDRLLPVFVGVCLCVYFFCMYGCFCVFVCFVMYFYSHYFQIFCLMYLENNIVSNHHSFPSKGIPAG